MAGISQEFKSLWGNQPCLHHANLAQLIPSEEIGQLLEVATATARNRVSRLGTRLGIASRRKLVAYAAARGFLWAGQTTEGDSPEIESESRPALSGRLPRCIWSETGRTAEDDVRDLRRAF